jgi:RNA polymerase sigma-70 factor (ECF subfamily)
MELPSDLELVRSAKAGDVPAFEALYRRYNDRIYGFAKQVTGSAEDACDVAQEAFIRAWDALPKLRDDRIFGVWLHRIALNLSRDFLKRRAAHPAASLDACDTDIGPMSQGSYAPGPERALISAEKADAVRRVIESLAEEHRLVVTLHHMQGMDVESVAGVLGVPKGTVMSRLSRARGILRRKLAPHVEED